jgi:hypothetical protein
MTTGSPISPPASVTCWSPSCRAALMTRCSGWWPRTGTCSAGADAQALRRFADPSVPCLIAGDWNSVPSGPAWEDRELNNAALWGNPGQEWARAHRVLWQHGPGQAGPFQPDTRALDYLIGWWAPDQGRRIGGIGFYDAAELAGDSTPTQVPVPDGRQRAIDRILVNATWKDAIAPGSYQVHQPADPEHPDSDHLRVSITIRA